MHTRTAIDLAIGLVNCLDLLSQLVIFSLMLTDRAKAPGVVSAHGNVEGLTKQADRILPAMLLDELKLYGWGCEKMTNAFFKISRSLWTLSSSRLSRLFSSSKGVWCPLPGKASWP